MFELTEIRPGDKAAYLEYLQEKEIYDVTLRIPYPYRPEHADEWQRIVASETKRMGRPVFFAIRNPEGKAIGGCGLEMDGPGAHRAEIGYWLAKPYWGRGIMPGVVDRICALGFGELGLVRISAYIFAGNDRSARVVEKCGFVQEGYLRKYYLKDGRYIDCRAFAKVI